MSYCAVEMQGVRSKLCGGQLCASKLGGVSRVASSMWWKLGGRRCGVYAMRCEIGNVNYKFKCVVELCCESYVTHPGDGAPTNAH
eukprot:2002873-Pyramimonas_sp.AAC.1